VLCEIIIPPRRNHKQTTTSNGEPATDDKGILQQAEVYDQPPKAYVVVMSWWQQFHSLSFCPCRKIVTLSFVKTKLNKTDYRGVPCVWGQDAGKSMDVVDLKKCI